MPEPSLHLAIQHILVALDASPHSIAALEAAAELAAELEAELQGLFIEDIDLLQAAEVPFTREVQAFTATVATTSRGHMQRQLDEQARRARRILKQAAERRGARYSFQVRQGHVSTELLAAAAGADLFLLGRAGHRFRSRGRLGATARAVLAEAHGPVLIMQQGLRLGHPVIALYDGSDHAEKALRLAARLARRRETGSLAVLVWTPDPEADASLRERIQAGYTATHPGLRVHRLPEGTLAALATAMRSADAGLLVVPATSPLLGGDGFERLLDVIDRPILLVR